MTQARPDEDPAPLPTAPTGTEAVSAESAALYRGLFTASADALLVADAAGHYLDANPAATALLGYTHAELQLSVADVVAAGPAWAAAEYERFMAIFAQPLEKVKARTGGAA